VHLLSYVVKCTVTNSPFSIQASCSKCPPSAWIPFLTCVTRELVSLRSTAVLRKLNRCELDPCIYDVFDSESALELNPKVVTLTHGTPCISPLPLYDFMARTGTRLKNIYSPIKPLRQLLSQFNVETRETRVVTSLTKQAIS
jgi:hypothetical protein